MYRILFIGIGSIAKRHISNLSKLLKERGESYQIDVVRSGKGRELEEDIASIISKQYFANPISAVPESISAIPSDYDIIFVTNPTSLHYDTIKTYVNHTKHMFIEKPAFDRTDCDISELGLKDGSVYYVACPLRYTSVLQYVKENIDCSKAIAVRVISSSYLPDWRPGTDYRDTYSAHKDLGGGVSIDLIHEWDYLTWLFGQPIKVQSVIGKYSGLEIDSDDSALYVAANDHMTYELHLDYYGRKTMRLLQIFLPNETVEADLAESRVTIKSNGADDKIISLAEDRNAYQTKELEHFFDIIEGRCTNDNDLYHALETLKLTRGEI